jgi:hypothetical protein
MTKDTQRGDGAEACRTMADVLEAAPLMVLGKGRPSPYERGYTDRLTNQAGPRHAPAGNASWAEKLYYRGWRDAGDMMSKR